jgi:hypothetical protein
MQARRKIVSLRKYLAFRYATPVAQPVLQAVLLLGKGEGRADSISISTEIQLGLFKLSVLFRFVQGFAGVLFLLALVRVSVGIPADLLSWRLVRARTLVIPGVKNLGLLLTAHSSWPALSVAARDDCAESELILT